MKFDNAVENISPIIQKKYSNFLDSIEEDVDKNLYSVYREYTSGDKYLPRPLLTLFGYISGDSNDNVNILEAVEELGDLILIPQVLRDILAIHDDIVDEDLVKFGKPTLPTSYSNLGTIFNKISELEMMKSGKDLSLFFADYLYSVLIDIVVETEFNDQIKIEIIKLINSTNISTQQGQIQELLLQNISIRDINKDSIIELYKSKAACYCYSFPFELGLTISKATEQVKSEARNVLLQIGAASQIIDDITGTFPGLIDDDKDSLGELMNLRRTLLLVILAEKVNESDPISTIITQEQCTESEALFIKKSMIKYKVIEESIEIVNSLVNNLSVEIMNLEFKKDTEEYLLDLLQSRVLTNLNIVKERVR